MDIEGPPITYVLCTNTATSTPYDPSRELPLMIPADQAYYWTKEWQDGEREAEADLAAGRTRVFDSDDPDDVIRWLLDTSSEDA